MTASAGNTRRERGFERAARGSAMASTIGCNFLVPLSDAYGVS
jgi:hypothetical protein